MNVSGISQSYAVNGTAKYESNAESHSGGTVDQSSKSDTVSISDKAMELNKADMTNKNSGDISDAVDKKESDFDRALALLKEVGIEKYITIMKTVKHIKNALARTAENFPAYRDTLRSIEESFDNQLPKSVSEAMTRLNEALQNSPEELRETVLRHLKEEMKNDETLPQDEAGFLFALG